MPVAWVLQHNNGSIAHIYVLDEYRKIGLAQRVLNSLIFQLQSNDMPVFAFIRIGNTASEHLFGKK